MSRSILLSVAKAIVLGLWACGIVTLVRPLSSPFHEIFVAVLVIGVAAHLVEAWLFARKRGGWRNVAKSDLVQILIFGGVQLAAIAVRTERRA